MEVGSNEPEIASETSNISRSGIFILCPLSLGVGTHLALTLRVPTYLSGSARSDVHCSGRVVHERHLPNGDIGYGIQFEQVLTFQQASLTRSAPVASSA